MKSFKRVLAAGLAVVCLTVFSVSSVFAATSPTTGKTTTGTASRTYGVYTYNTKTKTAVMTGLVSKKKTVDKIGKYLVKGGKNYKVTSIAAGTYKGATKLKTIKVYTKDLTKVNKNAFKGLKKSQLKKIKVVVTKKMSAKNFKKLKKAFVKAGLSAKNITRKTLK